MWHSLNFLRKPFAEQLISVTLDAVNKAIIGLLLRFEIYIEFMIRYENVFKLYIICFSAFFLLMYFSEGDAEFALQSAIIIIGEVFVIYSFIGVYQNLKSLNFRFCYVHRNYWISWVLELVTIALLFYFLLPYSWILLVCIINPMILIILLIYDRITTFFKGWWRKIEKTMTRFSNGLISLLWYLYWLYVLYLIFINKGCWRCRILQFVWS